MGLLTQLIANHHDTQVRDKANQIAGYQNILNDQRAPEDGGYTNEFKSQILQQMVGMAQGGDGGGKKSAGSGGGSGGGKSGGGAGGKAGEMFGVFQKLLGLDKPHPGRGQGGQGQDQGQAGGAGADLQGAAQTQNPQAQAQAVQTTQQSQPQTPQQAPLQANPQTLQRVKQIQAQRAGQANGQAGQGTPVAATPASSPAPFMSEEQKRATLASRSQDATTRGVEAQTALGKAKGDQDISQSIADVKARVQERKRLMSEEGLSPEEADAAVGIKAPAMVKAQGTATFEKRNGKLVKVQQMTDGSERITEGAEKQVAGGGLGGNAKNLLWAKQNATSDDPATQETANNILKDQESKQLNTDLGMKLKKSQLDIAMLSHNPTAIKDVAQGVRDGIIDPNLPNIDRGMKTAVLASLAKDGFNQAAAVQEFDAVRKAFASENSQQQLARRQNVSMAKESLPLIADAGSRWAESMKASGKSPALNSVELGAAKQGLYGPDAQAAANVFEGQIADVQSELSVIYMGSSSPTDKAIELAQKSLKSNWSLPTLNAQLAQIAKNIGRREQAINHVSVFGAGADSSYIPRGDDGQSASTEPKADVAATPAAGSGPAPQWKVQAQTKPNGAIFDVPGVGKVKKVGDGQFQLVTPAKK